MNIYLIKHDEQGYDYCLGHVIIAHDEEEVIDIAKQGHSDEGRAVWDTAFVELLGEYTGERLEPIIILTDFKAG